MARSAAPAAGGCPSRASPRAGSTARPSPAWNARAGRRWGAGCRSEQRPRCRNRRAATRAAGCPSRPGRWRSTFPRGRPCLRCRAAVRSATLRRPGRVFGPRNSGPRSRRGRCRPDCPCSASSGTTGSRPARRPNAVGLRTRRALPQKRTGADWPHRRNGHGPIWSQATAPSQGSVAESRRALRRTTVQETRPGRPIGHHAHAPGPLRHRPPQETRGQPRQETLSSS